MGEGWTQAPHACWGIKTGSWSMQWISAGILLDLGWDPTGSRLGSYWISVRSSRWDPTGSQWDPTTGSQWDPTGSQWDPTGSQWDPTGSQWDPTGSQLRSNWILA
jgi:hypothetical protein